MAQSADSALRIDAVEVPRVSGRLGLCACPGWRHAASSDETSADDRLRRDVEAMREFGAVGLVSLMQGRELALLGVDALPQHLERAGLWWKHLPITDMGVPDPPFETRWMREGESIRNALQRGENIVIHCWAGLGRTGTIAARLLIEFGLAPEAAILRVRHARPGSIQTRPQERYVLKVRQQNSGPVPE